MPNGNVNAEARITVTDELDADAAVISDGLRAYYVNQTGCYDFRPLAVFVSDPQTGKVIGGLHGRSEFGLVYVAWFFLLEDRRRAGIGSRVLAWRRKRVTPPLYSDRVDDAQHRGAPVSNRKQGYDVGATIDCEPPGLTRYYMMKEL